MSISVCSKIVLGGNQSLMLREGQYIFYCGLGGIVVRRWAYDSRVLGSKPALAKVEDSILGKGVSTNCAYRTPEHKWVAGPLL